MVEVLRDAVHRDRTGGADWVGAAMSASQNQKILKHLKTHGAITATDAISRYGILRLAARIHDLRTSGYEIISQNVTTHGGARVARYLLALPLARH